MNSRLTGRHKLGKLRYVTNPGPCNEGSKMAILVLSEVENVQRRDIIRRTWGSYAKTHVWPFNKGVKEYIEVFFILGYYKNDMLKKQMKVFNESDTHKDIIQANVPDIYENEARKILLAYLWTSEQCKNVDSITIITDTTFPNMPFIIQYLRKHPIMDDEILGVRVKGTKISDIIFRFQISPNYVKKDAFILTPSLAKNLYTCYSISTNLKPLHKADLFTTGILPEILQQMEGKPVKFLHRPEMFLKYSTHVDVCHFVKNKCLFSTAMLPRNMVKVWKDLNNPNIIKMCMKNRIRREYQLYRNV
jgi:hypothetical protein